MEAISLRIFKSMGTDEITQEGGCGDRRGSPGPAPEGPQPSRGPRSPRSGVVCAAGAVPAHGGRPPSPCPLGACRRAAGLAGGAEGRGEKKAPEVGSVLLDRLPLSGKSRAEKWPLALATQRWLSPLTRTLPLGWAGWQQTRVGARAGDGQRTGGKRRGGEANRGLPVGGNRLVCGPRGPV